MATGGFRQLHRRSGDTNDLLHQPTSPVTYGASPIAMSATATSGQMVAFSIDSTSTGTGTIVSNVLTVTGAGTLVIDANQAGY